MYQLNRNEHYLQHFLSKRLSKILIPFLGLSVLTLFIRLFVFHEEITLQYFIDLFAKGSTVIYNAWFVHIIILFYVYFYVSFLLFAKKRLKAILMVFALSFVYMCGAIYLQYGFWWYNTCFTFTVGLFWANYEQEIELVIEKYFYRMVFLFTGLLFVSHNYSIILSVLHIEHPYVWALAANVDNIIFLLWFLLIVRKFEFAHHKGLAFLGGISFEIYMIHGIVMALTSTYFTSSRVNDLLYTLFIVVTSISCSYGYQKIIRYLKW